MNEWIATGQIGFWLSNAKISRLYLSRLQPLLLILWGVTLGSRLKCPLRLQLDSMFLNIWWQSHALNRSKAISDSAERGVKPSSDFLPASKSEGHYQDVQQVVEQDRHWQSNLRKRKADFRVTTSWYVIDLIDSDCRSTLYIAKICLYDECYQYHILKPMLKVLMLHCCLTCINYLSQSWFDIAKLQLFGGIPRYCQNIIQFW